MFLPFCMIILVLVQFYVTDKPRVDFSSCFRRLILEDLFYVFNYFIFEIFVVSFFKIFQIFCWSSQNYRVDFFRTFVCFYAASMSKRRRICLLILSILEMSMSIQDLIFDVIQSKNIFFSCSNFSNDSIPCVCLLDKKKDIPKIILYQKKNYEINLFMPRSI